MPIGQFRSIGAVLPILKSEFPELSISKIRFLEDQGLVSPERAPSGYRRYSNVDIERLRYILRLQRDYFMPLKKIKERLALVDSGAEPMGTTPELPLLSTPPAKTQAKAKQPVDEEPVGRDTSKPIKLTRRQLIQVSGLSEATLVDLERQQLVMPRRGSLIYGREALMICVVTRKMQAYGMDTRHLRAIKQSAEREAGMIEQAIMPLRRHPQAAESLHDATQLVMQAHAALMYVVLHH
ncbi:MAG: MerR family transcriptional regulator [Propionibacteriaceae bacterium]|nr:MerR family transcriptional regulator [Propionibacteriaceae bacterium]